MLASAATRISFVEQRRFHGHFHEDVPQVAGKLLRYLADHLGINDLDYLQPPAPIPGGWETWLYSFRLRRSAALPRAFDRSLILRLYSSPAGAARARQEYQAQCRLQQLGFPVAECVFLEECHEFLGGPFLLMAKIEGDTMLRRVLTRPWGIAAVASRMGQLHAELHRLSADSFPSSASDFLSRRLDDLRALVEQYDLDEVAPGLDWLETHPPLSPARPSILHLDYHPLNLMHRPDGSLVVLDWNYADVGDRHADVATTLLLLERVPAPPSTWWHRAAVAVGRPLLAHLYLRAYCKRLPCHGETLASYRAYAALDRLVRYGQWLRAGPESTGCKPSLLRYLRPRHIGALCEDFRHWTGVRVQLQDNPSIFSTVVPR